MDIAAKEIKEVLKKKKVTGRLIIFKGVYDTLDLFADELIKEYTAMGYEIMVFQSDDMKNSLMKLSVFINKPVDAVITFNNLGFNMELVPGKNIWDGLGILCVNILMDHPFCYQNALQAAPKHSAVLCVDNNHMAYINRFFPHIPISGYLPHGGKVAAKSLKPLRQRRIDVLYAGGLSKYYMEAIMPEADSIQEFDVNRVCSRAYLDLIEHPYKTTEQALEESIREETIDFTDEKLSEWISQLHFIDLMAVSYYRELTVRCLVEAGIKVHVYGLGWDKCQWKENPNFIYHGKVAAEMILEKMQDTKIVLSTMTWFKDGTHDRVFNGMLAGAVAVTDSSKYMKEEFCYQCEEDGRDQRELVMFELEQMNELPGQIKDLLDNLDMAQKIADRGYQKALSEHTWKNRAMEMEEALFLPMREKHKKILIISHQLSRTGAPIVLLEFIRVCLNTGAKLTMLAMEEGPLRSEIENMGIEVMIQKQFIDDVDGFLSYAADFDLVVANTLITYEAIHVLKYSQIPVIWWIHEGEGYFEYFHTVIPDFSTLSSNIKVYAVSPYVAQIIEKRYHCRVLLLPFGVKDVKFNQDKSSQGEKCVFLTIGTYSRLKGQDILAKAIGQMSKDYLDRCSFIFCGNEEMRDEEIYHSVKELSDNLSNVKLLPLMPHEKILEMMSSSDCLIVPSRIDPVPTVAVEMMMLQGVCLCSEICGISYYLEDGVTGYLFENENVQELREKMEFIIDNRKALDEVGREARMIYQEQYGMEAFEARVVSMIQSYDRKEVL